MPKVKKSSQPAKKLPIKKTHSCAPCGHTFDCVPITTTVSPWTDKKLTPGQCSCTWVGKPKYYYCQSCSIKYQVPE
jgi:hypothetical protein